jgi:hypothetical protein
MGRKRVVHSPEELEQRRDRYWGDVRNDRRRARYHSDPQYRSAVRQQTRETYRRLREAAGSQVRDDDCSVNIAKLDEIGTARLVHNHRGEPVYPLTTLTVEEMATALNRNQQVLYRWFSNDMFPRPTVRADTHNKRHQMVYTASEAKAAMREFAKHQQISQYYRERHRETRDRIFDAVFAVRSDLAQEGIGV